MVRMRRLAGMMLLAGAVGVAARPNTGTVLHSFVAPPGGSTPYSGVIGGPAGELYGTTYYGGSSNLGVVYKIEAGGETVLYSFGGGADGANPYTGVIRDSAGNLYGTTPFGGSAANEGVVYVVDPLGKETVLYRFTGGADGGNPYGGVVLDDAGNLYGTTTVGGKRGAGVVFKLDPAGQETVLHSFGEGADGGVPWGSLVRGPCGDLYGTTKYGGRSGDGTVYRVGANGHETVLHSFGFSDGAIPISGVIRDAAGNLYGATYQGGSGCRGAGCGVVFKLDPSGIETVLYGFAGPKGKHPASGLIRDAQGNLYGTTYYGGTADSGVVFKVDPSGDETVLHSFTGGVGGSYTAAGVIRDAAGNLYGTVPSGGPEDLGVVYKLDPAGVETVVYSFTAGREGFGPRAGVIGDSAGNLYGTAEFGGPANSGVVYKVDASGENVLYSFAGGADGRYPWAGVIRDAAGNLYGTTEGGGAAGVGVVYTLDAAGNETVLHSFGSGADGKGPYGGVIRDAEGNLYGTTVLGGAGGVGCVFKLDSSGNETVLYSFSGGADGSGPEAGVIRDQAGNLFGTTTNGGDPSNSGVVFKIDAAGNETVLHRFHGKGDGRYPLSGVILDGQGNLYGTTYRGGAADAGVVYKVDAGGQETVLYSFTGKSDGRGPNGGVTRDAAGNV